MFAASETRKGELSLTLSRPLIGLKGIIINTAFNTFVYREALETDPDTFLREIIENKETAYILYLTAVLTLKELDMPIFGETSEEL